MAFDREGRNSVDRYGFQSAIGGLFRNLYPRSHRQLNIGGVDAPIGALHNRL